jgi:GT2 family glycosyltransferase
MISIIIPCMDQHSMTADCLDAIRVNTQDYEIILVDNGSTPPFASGVEYAVGYAGPKVSIIRNETNLGFPVAVNQGIKAAKGDVIILLNNDVICVRGWAERLLAHLDSYSIVGPLTNYAAGLQRVTIPVYQDEKELNIQAGKWAEDHNGESQEVNWIIGFCMAFKKSLWEEIGPFDESLWPCSGEEIIFCLEARKRGYKVGICKDIYIHHFGGQTFAAMQDAKQLNYMDTCYRNDRHIVALHGEGCLNQLIERSN